MFRKRIIIALGVLALSLGPTLSAETRAGQARARLGVLSLNLLFSDLAGLEERLEKVAAFVADQAGTVEEVDLILLQEVMAGVFKEEDNAAALLQGMLAQKGLAFELHFEPVHQAFGLAVVGNAILSQRPLSGIRSMNLPPALEIQPNGAELVLDRKATAVLLEVAGFGPLRVVHTHLCAYCRPESRLDQVKELIRFATEMESLPGLEEAPLILAGDLNIHLTVPGEREAYQALVQAGYIDSYGLIHDCLVCCSPEEGFEGCTFGRPGNPLTQEGADRIDLVMVKRAGVVSSRVVFGSEPDWVSDHSGLLTVLAPSWSGMGFLD